MRRIPRGGEISVSSTGEDDAIGFHIEAKGVNARVAAGLPALLAGQPDEGTLDARSIQAYFAGLVALACGLEVSLGVEGDTVYIDAKPQAQAMQELHSAVA